MQILPILSEICIVELLRSARHSDADQRKCNSRDS